jgi:hypothetical protein
MFGLFTPKCPLTTAKKAWVEWRVLWFADRFGFDRRRDARVARPTNSSPTGTRRTSRVPARVSIAYAATWVSIPVR